MYWVTLSVVALVTYLYVKHKKHVNYWRNKGVPFVKPFPFLGNYYKTLLKTPMADVSLKIYRDNPEAKILGTFFFGRTPLLIRDPNLIRQIGVKDFDHFTDHFSAFTNNENEPFLGKSLVALKGTMWRDMRSTLSPAYTGSKMRGMFPFMVECAENFVNYYRKICQNEKQASEVELKGLYTKITNDVIATTAFGIQCNSFEEPNNLFYQMGQSTTKLQLWRILLAILSPKLWKLTGLRAFPSRLYAYFDGVIKNTIEFRKNTDILRPDMIHLLLEAKKGSLKLDQTEKDSAFAVVEESPIGQRKEKTPITDADIAAQAFVFFFAGFETVSTTLSFASYELALNPEIKSQLQKEIDEVLESCGGKINYDALHKMVYLDMVVSETLRKWPPALLTDRLCTKAYTLKVDDLNICLKPGSSIHFPIFGIHRDPMYYPEPEKFDPERFNDQNKRNILPFTYMPFGVGPRACIGSRFALMETKLALFYMFANFDLEVISKTDIPLKLKASSLMAANGFWFGLKLRT